MNVLSPLISLVAQRLKSKTYAAAAIGTALTVLELNYDLFSLFIPEAYKPLTVILWPLVMLVMREATNEALASK
jgi:hypothetical protein